MNEKNNTPKIYGVRICSICKGICHKDSWRRKVGQRKTYYCSELHLRSMANDKLKEQGKKLKATNWWEWEYTEEQWIEFRDLFFEAVEVITP